TPSLNPFTAPPRSAPMLRSFLVPNTSATINNTINQCQMLNEPMTTLLNPDTAPRCGKFNAPGDVTRSVGASRLGYRWLFRCGRWRTHRTIVVPQPRRRDDKAAKTTAELLSPTKSRG